MEQTGARGLGYNVLIVDDSVAIRMILQRVLRRTGLPLENVFEAGDGCAALEILKNEKVSVILSDINMPNMDGLQLLAALKSSEWTTVPVLIISTESSQSRVMEAVRLGAKGFIKKPFVPEEIQDKLAAFFSNGAEPAQ
jgi:two-component system, chemotaxis family, chemotaxis protein CheY